jgi:MioC protein
MPQIHIIVGSVMGTALEVAEAVGATLEGCGHGCRIDANFKPGQLGDDPDEVLLICTSNTGMGDLPANIAPLYQHLVRDYPAVAGRRYGIINLGDSSYPNFAQAGVTLDEALADLGAVRIGQPLVLDAIYSDDPADEACTWAQAWEQQL